MTPAAGSTRAGQFIAVNSELKFMMQGAAEVSKAFASGSNPADVAKY